MKGRGWIERVLSLAEDAVEDLYQLDYDAHGKDEGYCSWCEHRRDLARAVKMARKQLTALDIVDLKKEIATARRKKVKHARRRGLP
jgi:DnaJ-domain-containing protein 1